jgi:DNA replicative helicase MCM subunit Mcm2 (Cdc46/Mcm family)
MNKTRIKILIFLLVISFGPYYIYQNVLYKDARDIDNEKSMLTITADNLEQEYALNPLQADSKYLNKTIEVKGLISEITDSSIVVDKKVFCKMNGKTTKTLINKPIHIKGRCIGYDDLFELVKFDQCSFQHH